MKLLILYNRNRVVRKLINTKNQEKWQNFIEIEEKEVQIEVENNKEKDIKRMPYSIGTYKQYQLWKFFIVYKDSKIQQLLNPRFMLRVGNDWCKITKIINL